VTDHAAVERRALADLLDRLGPAAPTLCQGWDCYDMAVHLAVRDRVPAAWAGLLPPLAGLGERTHAQFRAAHGFGECVRLVRTGAPAWSPMGMPVLKSALNLVEFVVHHEDVRRAQPEWLPRELPAAEVDAVWKQLRLSCRLLFRRVPAGVRLARPGSPTVYTASRGIPAVTITGQPVELLLYAFNRRAAARVEITGDDTAVATLASAPVGL
jgi:uncharacterized protein (TIGR03085 family)